MLATMEEQGHRFLHGLNDASKVNDVFWWSMLRSFKWAYLLDKSSVCEETNFLNGI
jgi:hypothetical protein